MRTTADRIRHTLLFEALALATVTPLVMWLTGKGAAAISSLAITLSLIAMAWNYGYNKWFDIMELRIKGKRDRTLATRVVHTLLFELGMLVVTLPLVAWWLDMGLWQALVMDIGFMLFFMIYALIFNWLYDLVFPVPDTGLTTAPQGASE